MWSIIHEITEQPQILVNFRQDPTQPEPFQALANLYEEGEDLEKGLQFALIAAQLATPDPDEWSRLADMSLEQSDVKQACFCYKKASESDPSNVRYKCFIEDTYLTFIYEVSLGLSYVSVLAI